MIVVTNYYSTIPCLPIDTLLVRKDAGRLCWPGYVVDAGRGFWTSCVRTQLMPWLFLHWHLSSPDCRCRQLKSSLKISASVLMQSKNWYVSQCSEFIVAGRVPGWASLRAQPICSHRLAPATFVMLLLQRAMRSAGRPESLRRVVMLKLPIINAAMAILGTSWLSWTGPEIYLEVCMSR